MANVDFGAHYKRFMRYFWDPEPRNDDPTMSPIWCLGRKYAAETTPPPADTRADLRNGSSANEQEANNDTVLISNTSVPTVAQSLRRDTSQQAEPSSSEEGLGWPSDFLDDFESRFWFTYRSNFPSIQKSKDVTAASSLTLAVRLRSQLVEQSGFTSDTGWGCMIRSGQCLIGNALAILRLGRNWRRGYKSQEERHLLSLFSDEPAAPFSLHRFVEHGASACGKHPGEWFGPSATSRCIQALSQTEPALGLRVYVNENGPDVYEDSLFDLARGKDGTFCPVLILVGIRLGIDRVTPVYWDALKRSLQLPQSMGIAGGRPSASHYFVGVQGDNFFYLDPHHTRPMFPYHGNVDEYSEEDIASCHTRRLRRLHIDQMDPSMLLAFLIRDEADWRSWREEMSVAQGKVILHIGDKEPIFSEDSDRRNTVDQVETFDDDDDDGELVSLPTPL